MNNSQSEQEPGSCDQYILFEFEGKRKDTSLVIMRSFQYFCEYRRQLRISSLAIHCVQPIRGRDLGHVITRLDN